MSPNENISKAVFYQTLKCLSQKDPEYLNNLTPFELEVFNNTLILENKQIVKDIFDKLSRDFIECTRIETGDVIHIIHLFLMSANEDELLNAFVSKEDGNWINIFPYIGLSGNYDFITKFIYKNDINKKNIYNSEKFSLLHGLALSGNYDVLLKIIEEFKIDIHKSSGFFYSIWHFLALGSDYNTLKKAEKEFNITIDNSYSNFGTTVWYFLALSGNHLDLENAITERNIDLKIDNDLGENILHYFAVCGNYEHLKYLFNKFDIDLSIKDQAGNTIFMNIFINGKEDSVRQLMADRENKLYNSEKFNIIRIVRYYLNFLAAYVLFDEYDIELDANPLDWPNSVKEKLIRHFNIADLDEIKKQKIIKEFKLELLLAPVIPLQQQERNRRIPPRQNPQNWWLDPEIEVVNRRVPLNVPPLLQQNHWIGPEIEGMPQHLELAPLPAPAPAPAPAPIPLHINEMNMPDLQRLHDLQDLLMMPILPPPPQHEMHDFQFPNMRNTEKLLKSIILRLDKLEQQLEKQTDISKLYKNIEKELDYYDIPEIFICPVNKDLMVDPVIIETGNTYDRKSISNWFEKSNTDPLFNTLVKSKDLIQNIVLKKEIENFLTNYKKSSCLNRTYNRMNSVYNYISKKIGY